MSRIREFGFAVDVSDELMEQAGPETLRQVRDLLVKEAEEADLKGPRGGRYVRFGPLSGLSDFEDVHAFVRRTRRYVITTKAKYVRP